jgi:Uma2 family endonuclease
MTQQRTSLVTSPGWLLPDDTEESIVGAEWHQLAIRTLVNALRDVAERAHPTWHVGDQLTLLGPQPDRRRLWRPKPDVLIHPGAGPQLRRELDTRTEGLPALVIEVLSPTTWEQDLALEAPSGRVPGKGWGYLELWGVPEYLTFDPRAEFVPGQVRAWRRRQGQTAVWEAGTSGRYESALGVSFAVEGPLLRVYDERGQAVPFDLEKGALLAERDRQLARQGERLAQQGEQIARQGQELAQQTQQLAAQAQLLAEEQAARRQLEQRLWEVEAELRRLRGDDA